MKNIQPSTRGAYRRHRKQQGGQRPKTVRRYFFSCGCTAPATGKKKRHDRMPWCLEHGGHIVKYQARCTACGIWFDADQKATRALYCDDCKPERYADQRALWRKQHEKRQYAHAQQEEVKPAETQEEMVRRVLAGLKSWPLPPVMETPVLDSYLTT